MIQKLFLTLLKLNNLNKLIKKFFLSIVIISLFEFSYANNSNLDSLKSLLHHQKDTHRVRTLNSIAKLNMESDPKEGLKYSQEALILSKKLNYISGLNYARNIKGVCFDILGQYDSSLFYYQQALSMPLKGNEAFIGGVHSNIGLIYWNTDDYVRALNSFHKSVHILATTKNYAHLSNALNNTGLIYHDIKDYDKSNIYFKKAIQTGLENKDTISVMSTVLNLAINYFETKQENNGMKLLDTYDKYINQLDEYSQSEFLLTRAAAEINTQITTSTEIKLNKALALKEKIGHTLGEASVYISLSELYQKQKNYLKSNIYYYKALKYTDELKSLKKLQQVYDGLLNNYLELNNKDSIRKYSALYTQTIDSVFSEHRAKAFSKEQIAFKTFEKEKENLNLTIEKNKIQARNRLIVFSSIALLVAAGFTFWGILYRKKQKTLKEQQELVHQAVAETELMERERIARDLHDGVGQKLSVVKMQLSLKNADVKSASELLDDAIQDVRDVSHNLLPNDLTKGLIAALEAMCQQINLASRGLKIHLNTSPLVSKMFIDRQHTILIYRMVQELVNNAIKYSDAKNIHINMDCEENKLKLALSDDGKGFDPNQLETNLGIGIKNISERIAKLIGSIQLTSEIGKGTKYNITIPI